MERPFRPSRLWTNSYKALCKRSTQDQSNESDNEKLNIGDQLSKCVKKNFTKKKIIKECPSEHEEQIKLIVWLKRKNLIHHHSPNGMMAVSYAEGAKHKRLGTSSGFPDLILPYARKSAHGLFIELKRVYGGKLSESQLFWRDFLLKEGYAWFEAKGCGHAKQIICEYFDIGVGD